MRKQLALLICATALIGLATVTTARDRLKTMPGYEQYQKMNGQLTSSAKLGALNVTRKDGATFEYTQDGKLHRFDVVAGKATEMGEAPSGPRGQRGQRGEGPERGRQFDSSASPDGRFKAFYRERNLWISDADGGHESAITTDGSENTRVKNGSASWVYGEELGQNTAIWWSPDNTKVAY